MSREAKEARAAIRTLLRGLAATGFVASVVLLVLPAAIRDAAAIREVASTPPVAPAPASDRTPAPGARVSDKPLAVIEGNSDSTAIREAHSDGGYQEWLERQPAERRTAAF